MCWLLSRRVLTNTVKASHLETHDLVPISDEQSSQHSLDHLLIFTERQLYRVMREYAGYFNRVRPHQGLAQQMPEGPRGAVSEGRSGKILAFPVLNGLHHDDRRAA